MPRKRNTRKKSNSKVKPQASQGVSIFQQNPIDEAEQKKMQAAMIKHAANELKNIPKLYEELLSLLRSRDPLGLIGSIALYSLTTFSSSTGVENSEGKHGILPNHLEILQSLLLTLPKEEWGVEPHLPADVQKLFDILPKLTQLILFQQIDSDQKNLGEYNIELQSILLKMRQHTFGVRNWGYYSHVIDISNELFLPLDDDFKKHYGFGLSDLITILKSTVELLEDKQSQHLEVIKSFAAAKSKSRMAHLYFENVKDLKGTPKEMISSLPEECSLEEFRTILWAHWDLRVSEIATFFSSDLQAKTKLDAGVVHKVFNELSHKPNALSGMNLEYMPLDNPFWIRPAIQLEDDKFYIPMPQAVFSHIHTIVEELAKRANISNKLEKRRSEYLESKTSEIFKNFFDDVNVRTSMKWKEGETQWEHDLVAVVDRVLFVIEAKSHKLTPSGKRGSPDRLKKHVQDIIVESSKQSQRLKTLLTQAKRGENIAIEICKKAKLNFNSIDYVVRISTTLSDLTAIILDESDFQKSGWLPENTELAPSIIISDLLCIFDILKNPILISHYLHERFYFQKKVRILGDELDILGLYLENGLNMLIPDDIRQIVITGMSSNIDKFFLSADHNIHLPKPELVMRPFFRDIITELSVKKNEGWLSAGLHLLSCADPNEQKVTEKALKKLRKKVMLNTAIGEKHAILLIKSPDKHKALVIFYLFSEDNEAFVNKYMKEAAINALKHEQRHACVVFGRCVQRWGKPFETLVLVESDQIN